MKKGQAAMEFLMTYGWAILVVLAAIGALAYFGVLSPDKFMPSKCMVSGGFSCVEFKMEKNEDPDLQVVRFYLQNNLGVDADAVNVSLKDSDNVGCTSGVDTTGIVAVGLLTNGQKSPAITFDGNCTLTGSSFKGTITVSYVRSGESESHTAGGSISGKFD
jgi:hypothetical protein